MYLKVFLCPTAEANASKSVRPGTMWGSAHLCQTAQLHVESCGVKMRPPPPKPLTPYPIPYRLSPLAALQRDGPGWSTITEKVHKKPNAWSANAGQCILILPHISCWYCFLMDHSSNILSA